MANCPKCNAHLKLTDWRPECPHCGVNMVYYGMEDRLLAEAEQAEAEHARFQKKIDRLKASTVGGKLQVARLIFGLLPIAGLFLTLATIKISQAPYIAEKTVNVTILTLVDYLSKQLDVDSLSSAFSSPMFGTAFIMFAVAMVTLLLSVVLGLLGFFRLLCSAQKKSCIKNIVITCVQFVLIAASCITFSQFASGINAVFPAFITAGIGYGVFVYAALHLPTLVANILFVKKPMAVKYKEMPDYSAQSEELKEAEEKIAAELEKAIENAEPAAEKEPAKEEATQA